MTLRAMAAFLRRDLRIETGYRWSFVLQILGVFPSVLMFFFLSRLFGDMAAGPLRAYGGTYFPFVLIGIAVQNYFTVAIGTYARSMRDAQLTGTLEAVLNTPVPLPAFIFGSAAYAFGLHSLRIGLYLAMGCALGGTILDLSHVLWACAALALSIAAFSALGILSAAFILFVKRGDPLNWIFSMISWLLGGVYYPVTLLPEWLQRISALIPMTHSLEALRTLLLGKGGPSEICGNLLGLGLWAVIGLPAACGVLALALARARATGSLGHH